ncbi:MAG: hypothetical protein QMC36_08180 [Patescibacteria group bacterium]
MTGRKDYGYGMAYSAIPPSDDYPLGTFGQLMDAFVDLRSSSGIEIIVNLALIAGFSYAGFLAGRWAAKRSLAFALALAVLGGFMFVSGTDAPYFVVNAGTFYLGFLYPVWAEAYSRVSP